MDSPLWVLSLRTDRYIDLPAHAGLLFGTPVVWRLIRWLQRNSDVACLLLHSTWRSAEFQSNQPCRRVPLSKLLELLNLSRGPQSLPWLAGALLITCLLALLIMKKIVVLTSGIIEREFDDLK